MKNLRVEVKLKNNTLYQAVYGKYGSATKFCRLKKIRPSSLTAMINLQMYPLVRKPGRRTLGHTNKAADGTFRTICENLSFILKIPVETLFPLELYQTEQTDLTAEINFTDLSSFGENPILLPTPSDPYQEIGKREMTKETMRVLAERLTPKELEVIKKHWGLDGEIEQTLEQIGHKFGHTRQSIRQIEVKAIKKLQGKRSKDQLREIHFP